MFLSFGSNVSRELVGEQDAMLIADLEGIAREQGHNYQTRHGQAVGDAPEVPVDATDEPARAAADLDESLPGALPVVAGPGAEADEWAEPADFRFAARPYVWTRGRTRPVQDLSVETLVSTRVRAGYLTTDCSAEHTAIAALCVDVRSVAEVAALLALPLGVARVLLADMIDNGWVHVHRNPVTSGSVPDLPLMKRVLAGLHRL